MQTREQFGGYVLLKKLAEDPLGETFRAGKVGKAGLERVALLRVFNGSGLDGETLWQRVSGRAALQQALRNPNLGDGIDMGQLRGTPYVAYDYVSGKNLGALLAQATQKRQPVPLDHALLIGERIALGLSVAAESRLGDERILHGFLVPHLVMISNEGETRLLGFEVAPHLREVATSAGAREQFARFISPEALGGGPAAKSDDVYSLGAILFEMLTGKRLPPPAANGYASAIDGTVMASEGTAIPADLANLLKKSLAPAGERLADASTWHKAITKLMLDGHYNPTTFNLAFFMHNLFREDIERETQELQAEKNIKVTPQAPAPAASSAAPSAPPAAPRFGLRDEGAPPRETTFAGAAAASSGSNKGMIIGIAAGAALVLGGGLYWLLNRPAAAPPQTQAAAPAQPAGLTPEELQAQIDKLVSEKLAQMQTATNTTNTQAAQDAAKKEEQIRALQKQLEDARRAPERPAPARPSPPPAPVEQPAASTASVPPAAPPPVITPATPAGGSTPPAGTGSSTTPTTPTTTTAAPPPEPVETAPAPAAPEPAAVRRGDLVTPGPGVAKPQLISLPNPRYPEIAKRTNRQATVVVPILVDENGDVTQVKPPTQKAGFGFDEAAMEAARRASFRPASKGGVPVKMWMELSVQFRQ